MADSKFTFLDRAIAYVSPSHACRRAMARYWLNEFQFGDGVDPRNRGWNGGRSRHASSENSRRRRKRINEIWDARDMEEKFCFVRGVLERFEQYVCGQITYQSRTGDTDFDTSYQDFLHDWCGRADITGRHRLREMVGLGFRGAVREGEYGWIIVPHGEEVRLQAIEADRIGSPDKVTNDEKNIGGIHINDLGQVTNYEIYKRTPNGQYKKDQNVPPQNFIHLFKPTRADQYHGDSWLAPALPHARDIHELFAFEKQAMKFASAFAGFIRVKDPFSPVGGTAWGADKKLGPGSPNSFPVQAGMIRKLMEGEEIQFPTSTGRPSGNLMQFVEILIREMALGLNLPFGFVYNMALLGGVTARIEVMQAMRTIRRCQKMLEDIVLNRVRDVVLERAIAFGRLPFHPKWRQGKWSFGGTLSGDSGNDVQMKILLMQHGILPAGNITEEIDGSSNGESLRTIAREIKEAQEIGADPEFKIPMELLAPGRFGNATQLLAAINTPLAPPPPAPKGLVGEQGDKAAGPLLEILEKYGQGLLERESAITSLVHLYGVTRAKAEKMIPEQRPENEPQKNAKDTKYED